MLHHVAHDDPALTKEEDTLETQGNRTDLDHVGVIPEQADQIGREQEAKRADDYQNDEGNLDTEPESFLDTLVKSCTVVETAHRLEALTEAQHGGSAKHGDALHDTHSGNSGIAVRLGGMVQADGRKGCQTLTGEGGESAFENHPVVEPFEFEVAYVNADIAASGTAQKQQAEADKLADDGSPACTGNTQIKGEDQQGVQRNIQNRTGDDAHHRVIGAALKAQLIIQHQRGGHPRSAQKDHTEVFFRVGENGFCRTQQEGKGLKENLTEEADDGTCTDGREKAGCCHIGGFLIVFLAQFTGNIIAAALTEEETHSLNDRHHGEHDTHSAGGGIALEHTDKIGIRHIVEGCDQHADDAGYCQFANQPTHGRFGHLPVFLFLRDLHSIHLSLCMIWRYFIKDNLKLQEAGKMLLTKL